MQKKIANILYLLLGTIFPLLIGALHTAVHFKDLTTSELHQRLSGSIEIMGSPQGIWNTWGLMSFMMGVSFIIIGLLHLAIIRKNTWRNYPSIPGVLAIVLYLGCVIYAGKTFQALPQYYGGAIGLALAMICLGISLRGRFVDARQG